MRGATEAEVIKRTTNTATITQLQSSVRHTCETTIASTEICLVQLGGNQNDFVERGKKHTHITSHLSRSFAQRRVGETQNLEEDSVVRPDSNFQALIQSAILEQTKHGTSQAQHPYCEAASRLRHDSLRHGPENS